MRSAPEARCWEQEGDHPGRSAFPSKGHASLCAGVGETRGVLAAGTQHGEQVPEIRCIRSH